MSRTVRLGLSEAQGHGKIFSFFSPQRALPCLPLLLHLGPGSKMQQHGPRWGWPLLLLCWTRHRASPGQVGGFLIGHGGSLSLTSCSKMRSVGCGQSPSRASPRRSHAPSQVGSLPSSSYSKVRKLGESEKRKRPRGNN